VAPLEVVWSLLEPRRLSEWLDVRIRRVTPEGPLAMRQRIEASTGPLDLFSVTFNVHRLHLLICPPLGIVNDETVTMMPLGPDRRRISFR
jgi:hypothetical protein